jgi:hypothetical protein
VPDPARPIAAALRDSPEAASLIARWEATQRAAQCIAPVCRSLASGFDPLVPGRCELRDAVLWLNPTSTAQAAKLRQAMPTLLSCLRSEGVQVYEIKFRVQPVVTPTPDRGGSLKFSRPGRASERAIDAVSGLHSLSGFALEIGCFAARFDVASALVRARKAQQSAPAAIPSKPPTD